MLQFTLNGRLAADPTFTTYGAERTEMARIRIASNQPGRNETDFFDVAIFGAGVEQLRAAHKGDTIKVRGNACQNVWHDDHGDRHENIALAATSIVEHRPRSSTATSTAEQTAAGARPATAVGRAR